MDVHESTKEPLAVKSDVFDTSKMYELISHYYICKTTSTRCELQLTKRELTFGLKPIWIDIDEAIRRNKEYLESGKTVNFCIQQEIYVLELIRDNTEDDFGEGRVYR